MREVAVELPAEEFVPVDPLVQPLVAHHVDALQAEASGDLLRSPLLLFQFFSGELLHLVREAHTFGLLVHPSLVFFVREIGVVDLGIPVAVAFDFTVDSRSVDSYLFRNLRLGCFPFQHPGNFVPLHFG